VRDPAPPHYLRPAEDESDGLADADADEHDTERDKEELSTATTAFGGARCGSMK
jgi:hypothetical protein